MVWNNKYANTCKAGLKARKLDDYNKSFCTNLLNWYSFDSKSNLLVVDLEASELIEFLCKQVRQVTAVYVDLNCAEQVEKETKKLKNLEIIPGDIREINFSRTFDYIVMKGSLSRYTNIFTCQKELEEYLEKIASLLKPFGKFFLATANAMGVKKWTALDRDDMYATDIFSYNHTTIQDLLKKCGFTHHKFYYPLPDLDGPNIIFTDEYLPNLESIYRNLRIFRPSEILYYHETLVYKDILEDQKQLFPHFCNYFLIELGKEPIQNEIRCISFNNARKKKYQLKTIIYPKTVEKEVQNKEAVGHIEMIEKNIGYMKKVGIHTLDQVVQNKVISQFVLGDTLDKQFISIASDVDKVYEMLMQLKENVLDRLEISTDKTNVFDSYQMFYDKEQIKKLHIVKYGLWDLLARNCFYIDHEYYFFDQEWMTENIPLEFILYRMIHYENAFESIKPQLYEKFGLTEYIELFEELDEILQNEIAEEEMLKRCRTSPKNIWDILQENESLKKQISEKDIMIQNKEKRIADLEEDNIKKTNELQKYYHNSIRYQVKKIFKK